MLNRIARTIFGVMLRVLLLLAGLVFVTSLLVAAVLLLVVWLLGALWARLTGQPVRPWTFQVNRQAMWNRFYRTPERGRAAPRDESNVIDAEIKEITEIKEIKPPGR